MLNKENLEQLLISKWTSFIDAREALLLAQTFAETHLKISPCKINKISFTRFEIKENGFLIWIEYIVNKNIQATSEFHVDFFNNLKHIKSIRSP